MASEPTAAESLIDTVVAAGVMGQVATILADPAWPTKTRKPGTGKAQWLNEHTKPRYHTMSADDILALPVGDIAAKDAMLVLWTTWMHLPLAIECIKWWGFTYATGMPWLKVCKDPKIGTMLEHIKPIYGPGVWFQHCTELLLIARRGQPFGALGNPRPARKGIVISPRQEHSRKPEEVHLWIEEKFPGPMLEMFARRPRAGWTVWGDQL